MLMIALDLIVIPKWGILGAAGASSAAYCLLALLQVRTVQRDRPLSVTELLPRRADVALIVADLSLALGRHRARSDQTPS